MAVIMALRLAQEINKLRLEFFLDWLNMHPRGNEYAVSAIRFTAYNKVFPLNKKTNPQMARVPL